ncbi:MAG: amino acid permease [Acidobacteriia bacterium]|nr:amino acid permease [Terriglobia bacterium]
MADDNPHLPTPGRCGPPETRKLARDLTVSHASAVVVGTIIGTGIFLVPTEMMQAVGSAKLVYLAWVVGGALSFLGALTYAELGAMKPEAGGEYVYLRDGYGPLAGFVYAWSTLLIAKPGSIATIATGMARILGGFPAFRRLPETAVASPISITYAQLLAIALLIFISFINYIGVKRAGEFQLLFTLLKVGLVLTVIVVAFTYGGGRAANYATTFAGAKGGMIGFMIAMLASLWAYDGWNNLNMVAGEIRRPGRSIPMALIGGVGIVAALYMLMNAALQYVMPAGGIAATGSPAADAMRIALGAGAASIFTLVMGFQMLATLNGAVLSGARVPFAAAQDGYFIAALARVHPRYRTPSAAIVFQAALAIVLVLAVGKFQALFSITLFAEWLFYMLTTSTVFIFRRREPDTPRPYRVWGYPLAPAAFIAASAVLLSYTVVSNVKNSLLGSLVMLAGVPVYFLFRGRREAAGGRHL